MPFRSEAQRRWMWSTHPEMARQWSGESGGDISIKVDASGLERMSRALKISSATAQRNERRTALAMAKDLTDAVRAHASGRPGPQVITGQYRASIRIVDSQDNADGSVYYVGTDAPQAARLEFGFVGVDAIGRHYHQPPFPHWRPALQEIRNNGKKYAEMLKEGL